MENLQGIVVRITFQDLENNYTVLKIKTKHNSEPITVIGNIVGINVGSVLSIQGDWKIDNKHGKQFVITKYKETLPASIYGIQKYLGSGLINGVGPIYAKKIVNRFGKDTLSIIENEPMRLLEIAGIGEKRVKTITAA